MENKTLRVGIIGLGRISGIHINGLQNAKDAEIVAVCDIDEVKLKETGDKLSIPEEYRFTDYHDLINCDIVDAVEICTPNYLHVPMAIDVVNAGKPVNVEKPLGDVYDNRVPELLEALEKNPQPNMMCFSYRFRPAVRYAKQLIEEGKIGKVLTVHIEYLQSGSFIEGRRMEWRFVKSMSGTGAIGDLGVHLIDMTRYLIGEVNAVCARKRTFVKQRRMLDSEVIGDVTTDDYCSFLADIEGGAVANFTVTRCAHGHSNTIKYDVFGTEGVISFNLNNPWELAVCLGLEELKTVGLHTVRVPAEYNASQEQSFVDIALGRFNEPIADIIEGARCQKIVDAIDRSSEENRWIEIE